MQNEGLFNPLVIARISLSLILFSVVTKTAASEEYSGEQDLIKRGWNDFQGGYGKRAWNSYAGGYGKRDFESEELDYPQYFEDEYEELIPSAGKRAWNSEYAGGIGKRAWNSGFAGGIGKRAWNSGFAGGIGKRAWNSGFAGGIGKRAWNSGFAGGIGKRAWNSGFAGGIGKRRWNSGFAGGIGKRAWNSGFVGGIGKKSEDLSQGPSKPSKYKKSKGWLALRGMWGKRSSGPTTRPKYDHHGAKGIPIVTEEDVRKLRNRAEGLK